MVTASDALKFRLLTRQEVASPRLLWPTRGDVWYTKLFLDETVEAINREVAARLASLLTKLHGRDPLLFLPSFKAQELANLSGETVTVGGQTRSPQ